MLAATDIAFSHDQFAEVVKHFATEVPKLFLRHKSTAHLALELQKLNLLESLATRFTVAIVGQMKAGKSTLLNALVGKSIAPTGVTETTATVNWFRHGQDDECRKFRVHWKDGTTNDLPRERAIEWIGTGDNALKTNLLEFFADAEFLRTASVVDTPGTRSVIQAHEETTQDFLAEKAPFRFGGAADAVVYAVNPVIHESERELLQFYGEQTRLPGASAYNSIAVVLKWEHLEPDPLARVREKCERLQEQLDGKVAIVLPASGLLARHVAEVPLESWQDLAETALKSNKVTLDALLRSEWDFTDDCMGAPLTAAARRQLVSRISWKLLPMCVHFARKYSLSDAAELRDALGRASGVGELRKVLETSFFSRAKLIKASTTLRKAWKPCDTAQETWKLELKRQRSVVELGQDAHAYVTKYAARDPHAAPIREYIERSLVALQKDADTIGPIQQELESLAGSVKRAFELFDSDTDCLKRLERERASFGDDVTELECLLALNGSDFRERLQMAGNDQHSIALERAKARLRYWSRQREERTGDQRFICAHACDILKRVLRHLEAAK